MSDRKSITVIYGTGGAAEKFLSGHQSDLNQIQFASTEGGLFQGEKVFNIQQLADSELRNIIIASTFLHTIIASFQQHNISLENVRWYSHEEDRLLSIDELGVVNISGRDVIYAFYDLAMNPATFDAAVFAARADVLRRRVGKNHLQFIIVPSMFKEGRPGDAHRYEGYDEINWRQSYIIETIFKLVPATAGVSLLACRNDVYRWLSETDTIFPINYDPADPVDEHCLSVAYQDHQDGYDIRVLKAASKAVTQVDQWLSRIVGQKKLITLTLREYDYQPSRNNNIVAWSDFFKTLDMNEYFVVVLRDTYKLLDETPELLSEYESFLLGSLDLNFRLAIYQCAYLNLTVDTGPSALLYLSDSTRYIMFNHNGDHMDAEWRWEERMGKLDNDNFPMAGAFQKSIRQPDTLDVIKKEFAAMVAAIECQ